ncbi:MAG: redox-sensing transcriptional repressor Rex [Bacteroidales bacterium]|nr:redox-sensing transcriptional repressor Rex [Bacteroidales bacterium]MCF8336347.1 redox-sensing transcriptional repressor Rex [Bacteroidales bacterium]
MSSTEFTKRLLTYRLSLLHLQEIGLNDVYSHLIAGETGFSAALIRKDFSRINVKGKRRGGYEIDVILQAINNYFGDDKVSKVILVGMGNIGSAIARYKDFQNQKLRIVAAFDIDPAKQRKKFSIPVYSMGKCQEIIYCYEIEAGIIAVPAFSAQTVCDRLVYCGIKGILNFAPVNLKVPEEVYVSNVSLSNELRHVIYHAKQNK